MASPHSSERVVRFGFLEPEDDNEQVPNVELQAAAEFQPSLTGCLVGQEVFKRNR